jgi:hypothetical protein
MNYLETLRSQSFEGWSDDAVNGYMTALISIQEKLWIIDSNILPTKAGWKIGIVNGQNLPLYFNFSNKFWVDMAGKTYKPTEVVWLNDTDFLSSNKDSKLTQLYIADCIEYDSWSGKKRDGYVAFLSKEAFDEYQRNEQLALQMFPSSLEMENGRYEDCSEFIHFGLNQSLLMDCPYYYFKKF